MEKQRKIKIVLWSTLGALLLVLIAAGVLFFTRGGGNRVYLSPSAQDHNLYAGMEVSELMKRLTGRNYPVFVDNMESVDDLANVRPTGQIIMAKCISNTALQVRPVNPIIRMEQKAA